MNRNSNEQASQGAQQIDRNYIKSKDSVSSRPWPQLFPLPGTPCPDIHVAPLQLPQIRKMDLEPPDLQWHRLLPCSAFCVPCHHLLRYIFLLVYLHSWLLSHLKVQGILLTLYSVPRTQNWAEHTVGAQEVCTDEMKSNPSSLLQRVEGETSTSLQE